MLNDAGATDGVCPITAMMAKTVKYGKRRPKTPKDDTFCYVRCGGYNYRAVAVQTARCCSKALSIPYVHFKPFRRQWNGIQIILGK